MLETEKLTRINEVKKVLYRIYLRDDTARLSEFVRQAVEFWNVRPQEVMLLLKELEEKKIVKMEKKLDWLWLNEDYAKMIDEHQETLALETLYF
ncbi:MAG: hypothetical protein HC874_27370 [Richelia sp. SL_2_1]|nr:hypothetical protein [Richelia sp. SL_2_1]